MMLRGSTSKRFVRTTLLGLAVTAFAAPAFADALHYFTQDNYLYKYDDTTAVLAPRVELKLNGTTSFTSAVEGRFAALAFDPTGTLWGATADGDFYTINTTSGAVTHRFDGGGTMATFDFRQDGIVLEIIGTETLAGGVSNLVRFDSSTGNQIGSDISITLPGGLNYAGNPASGYDSVHDTYHVVRGGAASGEANDFALNAYNAATFAHTGGPLQTNLQWSSAAGNWADGEFYFGYRPGENAGFGNWNLTTDHDVYFGRLNTTTGVFTLDFVLQDDATNKLTVDSTYYPLTTTGTGTSFGYAVMPVPEADSYALMFLGIGLAGFLARRRR